MFTQQNVTIEIPEYRFAKLVDMVEKLNKKSLKIGVPSIKVSKSEPFIKELRTEAGTKFKLYFITVNVTGNIPVYNGWSLVAVVDHIESGNIIKNFLRDDQSLPEMYRDRQQCDHCHTNHSRKKTLIVKNQSGEFKQVGSTCVNEFVQKDILSVISFLQWDQKIKDFSDEEDTFGARMEYGDEIDAVVSASIRVIKAYGFKKSDHENSSKSDLDCFFFNHTEGGHKFRQYAFEKTSSIDVKSMTEDCINWMKNLDSSNEFHHNIKVIASSKFVSVKYFGFIAAGVNSFLREIDKSNEAKTITNEYVPNVKVKDRIEIKVTLEKIVAVEGYYGVSYLHVFRDEDNRKITWFASSNPMEEEMIGKTFTIIGTVKKLDEYNGVKQTVLNRVKMK